MESIDASFRYKISICISILLYYILSLSFFIFQLSNETAAMWNQLAKRAWEERQLNAAERCYAALGDVSKARYLRRLNKIVDGVSKNTGTDGKKHFKVRASLALLTTI